MIRRPPRSTQGVSSAASDVYKRQMDNFPQGFAHYPLYFSASQQQALIDAVALGVKQAPFFIPAMPRTGTPMSVALSNFGPLGWVTDKDKGYRYEPHHPKNGADWPKLPDLLGQLWDDVTGYPARPEATLINWYKPEKSSKICLLYTSPSPRDQRGSRMPSSA